MFCCSLPLAELCVLDWNRSWGMMLINLWLLMSHLFFWGLGLTLHYEISFKKHIVYKRSQLTFLFRLISNYTTVHNQWKTMSSSSPTFFGLNHQVNQTGASIEHLARAIQALEMGLESGDRNTINAIIGLIDAPGEASIPNRTIVFVWLDRRHSWLVHPEVLAVHLEAIQDLWCRQWNEWETSDARSYER